MADRTTEGHVPPKGDSVAQGSRLYKEECVKQSWTTSRSGGRGVPAVLVLALVVMIVALTGCTIQIALDTKVEADGSGTIGVRLGGRQGDPGSAGPAGGLKATYSLSSRSRYRPIGRPIPAPMRTGPNGSLLPRRSRTRPNSTACSPDRRRGAWAGRSPAIPSRSSNRAACSGSRPPSMPRGMRGKPWLMLRRAYPTPFPWISSRPSSRWRTG